MPLQGMMPMPQVPPYPGMGKLRAGPEFQVIAASGRAVDVVRIGDAVAVAAIMAHGARHLLGNLLHQFSGFRVEAIDAHIGQVQFRCQLPLVRVIAGRPDQSAG